MQIGLALCLVLLCLHAALYWFLTDDAYISFRYARNLADGAGLVFNPGSEPVEGYTNFLWVVVLAGFDAIGLPPESVANVLSLSAGVLLWLLVVRHALSEKPAQGYEWLVLVPALFLALTRSYAVWCTSGLETKLFELLVVAGVLRTLTELHSARSDRPASGSLSTVLLALATLTRPDGLLISACVFAARAACQYRAGSLRWRQMATSTALYTAIVGGHFLFRRVYYGEWLPNTFYAKVSGTWWSMGLTYIACWLLEYGAVLWLPLLVAGVIRRFRCGQADVPLLFAAVVLPHLVYVISIGGDHFEYRPIDLYFPFIFLLTYDGAKHLAVAVRRRVAVVAYLVVCALGLSVLPILGHLQFPARYPVGFPGISPREDGSRDLIRRAAYPVLFRVPLIAQYCQSYNRLIARASEHFVGLRQEEHKLFVATVEAEGKLLARLIAEDKLPADMHVAIDSVGAIPYYSKLRTLDRLGLTDKWVARRGGRNPRQRLMAHERFAPPAYAEQIGVDLWAAHDVHLLFEATEPELLQAVVRTVAGHGGNPVALHVDADHYLLGIFPGGRPRNDSVRRLPWIPLASLAQDAAYLERLRRHLERTISQSPGDAEARHTLGVLLRLTGDSAAAAARFAEVVELRPNDAEAMYDLAAILLESGQLTRASELLQRAVKIPPPSAPVHNALGRALAARGELDAAAVQFARALAIDNSYGDAHCNLANVLATRGQLAEAVEHYRRAIRLQPGHPLAYENLATVLWRVGRYAEAVETLRSALRLMPENARLAVQLSWMLATGPEAVREPATALSIAEEVCQRRGRGDPRALRALAAAQAALGRFGEAASTARQAIRLAESLDLGELADELKAHLTAYEAGRPIHGTAE